MKKQKKAAIEIDELVKLIMAGIALLILLVIVGLVIGGEFTHQGDKLKSIFTGLG